VGMIATSERDAGAQLNPSAGFGKGALACAIDGPEGPHLLE